MILIAEVKTESPFSYRSTKSWDEQFSIAREYGDWISIHTDPRWGGSFDLITKARGMTFKPILAKGIHATDNEVIRALAHGATYVLVVGRVPDAELLSECLIEPNSLLELAQIPTDARVVWNSRDLSTGGLKTQSFEDARKIWKGWICQASNITSKLDIKKDVDAILLGEGLEKFLELSD